MGLLKIQISSASPEIINTEWYPEKIIFELTKLEMAHMSTKVILYFK